MAAVPITIVGTITSGDKSEQCTITGLASLTGLTFGGGPIPAPPPVDPGYGVPEGGRPTHPIALPPGVPTHPIYIPPTIWPNPPEGTAPMPTPPIYIPPPVELPPTTPGLEVKVYWTPVTGWGVALIPTGEHPTPSKK